MIKIKEVKCEYLKNPIGIGKKTPRFSWIIESDLNGTMQTTYQIIFLNSEDLSEVIFDTGKVISEQSIHVKYSGPELKSRARYFYKVKVWDNYGNVAESDINYFETGIFDSNEWLADWIGINEEKEQRRSPYLRKEFSLKKKIRKAIVYASALGLYELRINGHRVGDYYFTPGWTSYKKRVQYQTYDVTNMVKEGDNTLGTILGLGWFRGYLGWEGKRDIYDNNFGFILQMHCYYEDGTEEIIKTDETWKYSFGGIIESEIYHGEVYDANLEPYGWDKIGYDDSRWKYAIKLDYTKETLIAQENIPAKKMEEIKPIKLITTPKGEKVIDFGQNMVGFVRFKVKGEKGQKVVLRHAEVLDKDGNFYIDNLRKAKQRIEYTLRGDSEEIFEPHFTYQGFRYVNVEEYPGVIDIDNFSGIVIYSGMETTGEFECSDELINRLQQNIVWSQKGNFVDVPTDCPQRDERLGWTGDAQVFIRTACFNMDVSLFFYKWLHDLSADQYENGGIPFVIPDILKEDKTPGEWGEAHSSAAWGDAATICPWTIYLCYGDTQILQEQYGSMKKWVEYIRKQGSNEYIWNTGFHFGDWLALDTKEGSYIGATPKELIATAFYAYSTWILAKTAQILEYKNDEKEYYELYEKIKKEFRKEFVTPNGRLASHTQTAHVLALMFDLLEEKDIPRNVEALIKLLEETKYHLTTGFVGTPYLCHVLTKYGRNDIALKLLKQQDYPSWLYQVTKGATTIWEHWDGIKEDGSFWSADMNSFNHYAYGSIGDWMYRVISGIEILEAGYKKIMIKPYFEGFEYVRARHKSMYGDIKVEWVKKEKIILKVKIPVNTEATIAIEKIDLNTLMRANGQRLNTGYGIKEIKEEDKKVTIVVGSGEYEFEFNEKQENK